MSLSTEQVLEIRKEHGWNEIVPSKTETSFSELSHALQDPMGLMLLSLAFIYLFVGKTSDAVVLFISYIPITAVDVVLELRSKKALKALKASLKSTSKVIRNNQIVEVQIREIVPGDHVLFEEGQSLPADGIIIECDSLQINEAALTGESLPVDKEFQANFFCGTTVLQGRGIGLVEKIGRETQFGKIAILIEEKDAETTPLKKKVNAIVKKVIFLAIFATIFLFIITFLRNHSWTESLIESLTFGMSVIPEEFPLVFTLYLSLGAYRLTKHGVLVKSLPSVEALGGVDVICTDKTGTLTEGKFQLDSLEPTLGKISPSLLWQSALLACEVKVVDAMEVAIFEKGEQYIDLIGEWELTWDYPFELKGKHMSHVWKNKINSEFIIAMKGSVEGVLEHCLVDSNLKDQIAERVTFWASKGKRLLGLARRIGNCNGDRFHDEANLEFIGILIFSDPVRKSAKDAVMKCQESGIEIKMLTGDHPITAHAVADELGLTHSHDNLYTGDQLSKMSQDERIASYKQGAIFSRVLPEQKYEMVQALKSSGKVVAMTGDGVNDAPALKAADIGISMGANATDVARNSAQMVLMQNDFQGITEGVFEGRKIFLNLKRSFSYLISFHVPIIFFAFVTPLLGLGNLLLPIHIVLLQLIVHPVSAYSFENLPAAGISTDKSLMNRKTLFESILSGLLLSFGCFFLYHHILGIGDVVFARSVAIATIMLGNIFFVLVETWPQVGKRFLLTTVFLLSFLVVILYAAPVASLFYLTAINLKWLIAAAFFGFIASAPTFILRKKRKN
jgi:Ca2+-transporting ATPase